jgi:hypothetical protein
MTKKTAKPEASVQPPVGDQSGIPAYVVDGLIRSGLLRESERLDPRKVNAAADAALEQFVATANSDGSVKPSNLVAPKTLPIIQALVSPSAQQALNELVMERFLVRMVRHGLCSAEEAIGVWDDVFQIAVQRNLYAATIEAAKFGKESLLYRLGQEGLI